MMQVCGDKSESSVTYVTVGVGGSGLDGLSLTFSRVYACGVGSTHCELKWRLTAYDSARAQCQEPRIPADGGPRSSA